MPITPKEIADNTIMEWATTGYGWIVTGIVIVAGLIWRTSKEHSRYEAVLVAIEKMQEAQGRCITQEEHDSMQIRCQEHLMHVIEAKIRVQEKENLKDIRDLQHDISNLNANICIIMRAMNIEPISMEKRRRED